MRPGLRRARNCLSLLLAWARCARHASMRPGLQQDPEFEATLKLFRLLVGLGRFNEAGALRRPGILSGA